MRVCLTCQKFGKRVETCTTRSRCRIANKGTTIIPAADYLSGRANEGDLIEMPPTDPNTPLPGDALYGSTSVISGGPLPLTIPLSATSPHALNVRADAAIADALRVVIAKSGQRLKELEGMPAVRELFKRFGSIDGKISGIPSAFLPDVVKALDEAIENAEREKDERTSDGDHAEYERLLVAAHGAASAPVVTSPDGNPKTAIGITKPSLHAIPPLALLHLGQAMADGNRKYGLVNWRHDPITMSVYVNAIWRHFLALWDGQDADPKTGIKHLAYIMANCAILLDAEAQGTLTDDRSPIAGQTAALIEAMTAMMQKET